MQDLSWFSDKWTTYYVAANVPVTLRFENPAAHVGRHGNDQSGTITFDGYVYLISNDGQYRAYVNHDWIAIGRMNSFNISTGGSMCVVQDEGFDNRSPWACDMSDIVTCWEYFLSDKL